MHKLMRIVVLVVGIAIIPSMFLPLWKIDLQAPQYPEGLEMKIWLNHLSGDVDIINDLNHYIGMKKIEEDSIPELKIMLPCIITVAMLCFITVLFNRKWILFSTYIIYLGMGAYGFTDFYQWEYDYGHNLDPHAAIKIPGMSYQPPFVGSKQLLNFTSYSYPDIGGFILMISGTILFLVCFYEIFINKTKQL